MKIEHTDKLRKKQQNAFEKKPEYSDQRRKHNDNSNQKIIAKEIKSTCIQE